MPSIDKPVLNTSDDFIIWMTPYWEISLHTISPQHEHFHRKLTAL
jgi:hypothetical protein